MEYKTQGNGFSRVKRSSLVCGSVSHEFFSHLFGDGDSRYREKHRPFRQNHCYHVHGYVVALSPLSCIGLVVVCSGLHSCTHHAPCGSTVSTKTVHCIEYFPVAKPRFYMVAAVGSCKRRWLSSSLNLRTRSTSEPRTTGHAGTDVTKFHIASGLIDADNVKQVNTLLYCIGEEAESV